MAPWWSQPPVVTVTKRTPDSISRRASKHPVEIAEGVDQAAGQQETLAERVAAVGVAELRFFLVEIERAGRLRRGDDVERCFVVLVDGIKGARLPIGLSL